MRDLLEKSSRAVSFYALIYAISLSILILPFVGLKGSAIGFVIFATALLTFHLLRVKKTKGQLKDSLSRLTHRLSSYKRYFLPITALCICVVPLLPESQYITDVLTLCLIYSILALGIHVIVGLTGLLHLGFAAFYAIGAYGYALLSMHTGMSFWLATLLSSIVSAFAGLLLAFPALRLRGDYLAIVTLGFGEILRIILNNWAEVTNGPNGLSGIPCPSFFGYDLANPQVLFYLFLVSASLVFAFIYRVEHSRIGRAWLAIKEDETAAASLGIDVTKYKLFAFAFGSFWAGLAGALFASKMGFVSPESFTFLESVLILCMVILGGLGSIYGAVVGAFILIAIPEILRDVQTYRMLLLGLALVLMMLFMPKGILTRNSS